MKSHINANFRRTLRGLPKEIRQQAREAYKLFQQDIYHPGLYFKRVHPSQPYYSVRIGLNYRAVGIRDENTIVWFWIGSHSDYDKLISRL